MTVSMQLTKRIYAGNGLTRQWEVDFPLHSAEDLQVIITSPAGNETVVSSGYELNAAGDTLTYPTQASGLDPLAEGWTITLVRHTPPTQQIDLLRQGELDAEVLEEGYDKLTLVAQELSEKIDRCIKYPVSTQPASLDTDTFLNNILAAKQSALTYAQAAQTSAAAASQTAQTAADTLTAHAQTLAAGLTQTVSAATTAAENAASSATQAGTYATQADTYATQAQTTLSSKANTDLSNLSETGESHFDTQFAAKAATDLSNVTGDGKKTGISWMAADFTTGVSLSNNTQYTATYAGLISVVSNAVGNCITTIWVNGRIVYDSTNASYACGNSGWAYVFKGQTYKVNCTQLNSAYIYKLEGAK